VAKWNRHQEPPEDVSLTNLWRFFGFSLPYWKSQVVGFLTGIQRMVLGLWMPLLGQQVVDEIGTPYLDGRIDAPEAWQRLGVLIGITTLIMAVHAPATLGRFYFPHRALASAIRDIRYKLFSHLQRLSLGFHTQRSTGGIVARVISDVQSAQGAFDVLLVQLPQNLMVAIGAIAVLLYYDWQWALVALAATPLFVVTTRLVRRPMRRATRKQRETVEKMSGRVQERMGMIREVQAFTAEPREEEQVLREAEELRHHTLRQRLLAGLLRSSAEITRFITISIVMFFGVYRIVTAAPGEAPQAGAFLLFWGLTQRLLNPMNFFADLYMRLQVAAAAADRVLEFFDTEPQVIDAPDAKPLRLTEKAPEVKFEDVKFSYPSEDPEVVLDGVSFTAEAGQRVVLVGESGAGKSTLLSLLPRFYDIQQGRIVIDDQDITRVTVRSLRKAIAIVPQEPVLFSGTIRENIEYGDPKAGFEQVREAARAANAEGFILEMEEGYDTEIGERGVRLSGGQLQRVAIARAFLKDPAILILDEATSNLDAVTESLVLDAIDRLAKGRTTFIIAHRLSTARTADKVVVIDAGRVAQEGTHDELVEVEGPYATLWERQVGEMV